MTEEELRRLLDGIGPEADELHESEELEALATGALSAEAANRLRARLSGDRPDLLDLYEPLDEDVAARTAARVLAMRSAAPAPVRWSEADQRASVPEPTPAAVKGVAPARRVGWLVWLLPVWAAAITMLVVGPSAPAPLPEYRVELASGDRAQRSDEAVSTELPSVSAGSLLRFVVTPVEAPVGSVRAAVYAAEGWAAVAAEVEVDPESGAVLVIGEVGEAFDAALGEHELVVVIASEGAEPSAEAGRSGAEGTQALRVRYAVQAAGEQ
jgi:hypothetical protein